MSNGPSADSESAGTLILNFTASRTTSNKFLLLVNYLSEVFYCSNPQGLRQALKAGSFLQLESEMREARVADLGSVSRNVGSLSVQVAVSKEQRPHRYGHTGLQFYKKMNGPGTRSPHRTPHESQTAQTHCSP
jgi:hypothetical protein